MFTRRDVYLFYLSALVTVGVTGLLVWKERVTPHQRMLLILVLGTFAVVLITFSEHFITSCRRAHIYLGIQTSLLTLAAFVLFRDLIYMFYILSVQTFMFLPWRKGVVWLGVFALITLGIFVRYEGWDVDVWLGWLVYSAGYLFFGIFGHALVRSQEERIRAERLLQDLQKAHQQLQEYALKIEELAITAERGRLAREMHDTLGHRLTVAAVQLEGAQRLVNTHPERAKQMIATVREQVLAALDELRTTVARLRSPVEVDLPLPQALRRLTRDFTQATGIQVHLQLPDTLPPLPESHRLALYRAAQETLTNVQRHAKAHQVEITLDTKEDRLILRVRDDGQGIPENAETQGFGLRGLRERAVQLGGTLHVTPLHPHGTEVVLEIPIRET